MNRIKWAERRASQLLESMGLNSPAIPVWDIARDLKIIVSEEDLPDEVSGFLYRDESDTIISVNKGHPHSRKRFTIAHEIGHFLLHEGNHIDGYRINFRDVTSSQATSLEEIEANAFAATLLMPDNLIRKSVLQMTDGLEALPLIADEHHVPDEIVELAEQFGVSTQALLIRLGKLGLLL